MAIPDEVLRKMGARKLAKEFKGRVPVNMAIRLPEDITDRLGDDQVEDFFGYCRQLGLVRRHDCFWENSDE